MTSDEIYQRIKAQITGGKLPVGTECPGEFQLASQFDVSRGTVRTALKRLAREGFLDVVQGRRRTVREPQPLPLAKLRLQAADPQPSGVSRSAMVTPSFGEYLRSLGREDGWEPSDDVLVSPERAACRDLNNIPRFDAAEIATKLNVKGRGMIIWFLRLRAAKGMPLALQWTVVPTRVVNNVGYDDLHPGGLTKLYQDTYGIRRAFAEAHYAPTLASREEARNLKVDRDSPLIEERRISYFSSSGLAHPSGADMVPYEYLLSLYTDRVSLDFSWYDG